MLILGIDPGLAITGYGLVRKNGERLEGISYGFIGTPSALPMSERLLIIFNDVKALIERYLPDAVAVEQLFFCKNTRTALQVGQARGAVLTVSAQLGRPVYEYTPLQIKQAITGYGKADKKQIQQMVQLVLQLKEIPSPDDVADALAIAISHIQSVKWHSLLSEQERKG